MIGLGTMGRRHVRILRNLDGVILAGIADPAADPHLALSDVPIVATIEQLLERRLDYCVVATPASTHAALAIQLAQARIATLIEKLLATTLDDAAEVETAFARAGTLAAVGHIERYSPSVQALRTHLSAGALGRIYQVATRRQGPCPSRVTDVGVILDLATHDIDSVTYARPALPSTRSPRTLPAAPATGTRIWSSPSACSATTPSAATWSTGCRPSRNA